MLNISVNIIWKEVKSIKIKDEIFKNLDILDFKNKYKIGNKGSIFSIISNKIIKSYDNKSGYLKVNLHSKTSKKIKKYYVHRLVAIVFIPNPENKPVVNHLDKNRTNNNVENLEWCTRSENDLHKYEVGNLKPHNAIKVDFYDLNKEYYRTFNSLFDACKFLKVHEKNSYRLKDIIIKNDFKKSYKNYYIKIK